MMPCLGEINSNFKFHPDKNTALILSSHFCLFFFKFSMGITYTAAAESAANNYMENGVTVCITGTVYKTITFSLQESSTGVEGTIIVKEGDDNDLYKCTTRDSFIVEELLKLKVGDSINVGGIIP